MKTIHSQFDIIIKFLAINPASTTKQIHSQLTNLSLAQVYNIINHMLDEHILVKNKGLLSLHTKRISELSHFVGNVISQYRNSFDLKQGEKRSYVANNFQEINVVWSDVSSNMLFDDSLELCYYDPHPYHILGENHHEILDLQKFISKNKTIYYIIGGTSFLDVYGANLIGLQGCKVKNIEKPLFDKRTFYATYGEYIYTVTMPQNIYNYFELFFSNTQKIEEFNQELFSSIFTMKGKFTLEIERNQDKSNKMSSKIKKILMG